jgi:hypothetical protein
MSECMPAPMTTRTSVGLGRFVVGIVGSNPARGKDACLCVYMLCCPASVEAFATG